MTPLPCVCSGPGFCERYQIQQSLRAYQICSGTCPKERPCTRQVTAGYQSAWARRLARARGEVVSEKRSAKSVATKPAKHRSREEILRRFKRKPCRHRGEPTGETLRCKTCGGEKSIPLLTCTLHGTCTEKTLANRPGEPTLACCKICPQYETNQESPWRWLRTTDLIEATVHSLLPKLPADLAGVAGVARSGLIPASVLAVHLHLPLYSACQHTGSLTRLSHGVRGESEPTGRLLIVDDTIYSGHAMRSLQKHHGRSGILYAATFSRPEAAESADVFGELLPCPHLLEWCLFNSVQLVGLALNPRLRGGVASDFDGVFCHDPDVMDADEGEGLEAYKNWMLNAKPYLLPRRDPVPLVITFRLERWREPTLAWCQKWGVRIADLRMHPAATASERNHQFDVAEHKGKQFAQSPCSIFIESDPVQAKTIFEVAKRPVICPATAQVFQ